jgi:RNA-binding protein
MNTLTTKQKKYLRGRAHDLKPIVYIGQQGMSDAVLKDANRALDDHELIKIRFIDYKDEKRIWPKKLPRTPGRS